MVKHNLLIIDDDIDYLKLLAESLEDSFEVKCAHNLSAAQDLLKENIKFDIALVDENIGNEKGSAWIKSQQGHENSPTSFVLYSGMATEEAILKGLECGADDFLAKPFSLLALNSKLEKLIEYQDKIHDFEDEIKSKNNVINVSMAQASKYGSCMQLTSKLNHCFSYEQIRDEVFSYFNRMDLHGCIAFYPINDKPSFYSAQKGVCSPVEIEVMELLKFKSRLYRFGSRTIFNHTLVSLFILNLENDTVDTDIFIDALASVIECIGSRIAFITYKNSLVSVQEQIKTAVSTTKKMVEISKHHQQEVMNEIVQKMGTSFHILDMTQEQEDYLMDLVHGALKKHSQDDINFLEVTQLLDQALFSIDQLQQLNTENDQIDNTYDFDDEDELF
ncbi:MULTISPECIES: response regulator transcription factor [Colwellia]|uniref:DNA-binding response regulator n=1 Tax=Colwellia marinimaniae TaxID=1513592 RepID=A0ABQ0MWM0_9GAMM|nr:MULTISPECIES: response regulator [Colwellia]GAW96759.1 DNA-binding response regulator [Colwellia marinimaniae]